MRDLPDSPFTRADARAIGWSDAALSRAARAGTVVRLRRGYFARADRGGPRVAAIAAAQDVANGVISHRSALLMHDLPIVGPAPLRPEITVPSWRTGSARGAHLHRATLLPDEVVSIDAAAVTSAARTVIDIGRSHPTSTAVAAMDSALHRGLTSVAELDEITLRCWNWPGIRRALRALRLTGGRAESTLESVSRLVIRWLRLPSPELQPLALDRFGHAAGRLDFYWDECGVAGEADGRSKYDARPVLTAEKERQELLEDHALVFVRWGWDEAVNRPSRLRSRLVSGFDRGRARDRSGFPRMWSISTPESATREENVIVRSGGT